MNNYLKKLSKENGRQPDEMSEFSILTNESELLAKENRLDLRVTKAEYERILFV